MSIYITITKDKEKAKRIRKALEENGGYCPRAATKTKDTRCMCKEFLTSEPPCSCGCGLYEMRVEKD